MDLHISDFTQENYGRLLDMVKAHYKFSNFSSYDKEEKFVLWRHDIDFSLEYSLQLARIEAGKGISSTFFFLPHCEFYNLLEKRSTNIVHEIASLGHEVGIHFDSHYYNVQTEDQLEEFLENENMLFRDIIGIEPTTFSFHNTTEFTMSCVKMEYAGLISPYASYFQDNVEYCSDSNGYWRFERLQDFLEKGHQRIQVLTHPGWWQVEEKKPYDRVKLIAEQNMNELLTGYENALKQYRRINAK